VVVTGAASGIGRAVARRLGADGANVIGVDLKATGLAEEHRTDLSDPEQIDRLVDHLPDEVDGLCNVAGVPPSAPPWLVLAVNAKGLQRLTEGLVPKMSDGGSIVNVASSAGMGWAGSVDLLREFDAIPFRRDDLEQFAREHLLEPGGRSYVFSKEFVVTWTMTMRWAWRDRGIRMNAVSPGPVDTPILSDFVATLERAPRIMEIMDRPARPDDIAPLIAFLLTDESAWFRGCNLAIDGGLTSHLMAEAHGLD
jgi:NAD(P)-dependent dehydrogenase (short-subunit alcohol dehydrogenase family)